MSANNLFITGIGGFRNGIEAEVIPSAYVGDAGDLPGTGEMTASVMFWTKPTYSTDPADEFLFGNLGTAQGWAISLDRPATNGDNLNVNFQAQSSGGPENVGLVGEEALGAGGLFIATLSLSQSGNVLRGYVNGVKREVTFDGTYVASVDRPTIGVAGPTPLSETVNAAISTIILGCAYAESFFEDEQIWLHQAASLQNGDIVHAAAGGGLSGAGMPNFTNVWSARRGNNGIGVATADFIAAQLGFPFAALGNLPPAGATWADENTTSPANFTRRTGDVSGQTLFVLSQKNLYSGG